jgi:hypothetical protein
MKFLVLNSSLKKIGNTPLNTELQYQTRIPVPDALAETSTGLGAKCGFREWQEVFNAWPTANAFKAPPISDVIFEGLKVIARGAAIKEMVRIHREKNGSSKRGKQSIITFVEDETASKKK